MLDEKICKLREELNNSIINGQDYNITYQISVELDELIAEYYRIELNRTERTEKTKRKKAKVKEKIALIK